MEKKEEEILTQEHEHGADWFARQPGMRPDLHFTLCFLDEPNCVHLSFSSGQPANRACHLNSLLQLAMKQTTLVLQLLQAQFPSITFSIGMCLIVPFCLTHPSPRSVVSLKTVGDKILDVPLAKVCESSPSFIDMPAKHCSCRWVIKDSSPRNSRTFS